MEEGKKDALTITKDEAEEPSPRSCFQKLVRGPLPAYSLVLVDFFGLGCIMPLLPFFCKDFEGGGLWLGAILTAQAGGVVVGTIFVGTLSDMFGRKKLAIYSMVGDGIFFFLSGSMTSPLGMLIVRCLAGMFCPIPCAYGWVIDVSKDPAVRAKRLGLTTAYIMGGMFFGFAVAGVVGEFFGLFYAMLIPAILAFANAFFIAMAVPASIIDVKKEKKNKSVTDEKKTDMKKPNPGPVIKTAAWMSISLINFAVGLQVGHFLAVAMLMMVKKHNFTPSGLAVFNVSTIFVMIVANAFFFPWCYKRLGAFIMMPVFIAIGGIVMGISFYLEYNLVIYMAVTIPGFLFSMTLLPAGQTRAAELSKVLAPDAIGTVQGMTRMSLEFGKTVAPIISTALYGDGDGTLVSYLWVAIIMVLASINFVINGKKDGGASNMHGGKHTKEDGGSVELSSDIQPKGSSI